MNLIEKLKNRETKKKLRDENIRLRTKLNNLEKLPEPKFCQTRIKNIQQVQQSVEIPEKYADVSDTHIKNELARNMIDSLYLFIEYDIENTIYGGRIYTANLYVATGELK